MTQVARFFDFFAARMLSLRKASGALVVNS
jgi:hypothetical protein